MRLVVAHLVALTSMLAFVEGHGTITVPAMRHNPTVQHGKCPYCQGGRLHCNKKWATKSCLPPTPCWGATSAQTVSHTRFDARHRDLKNLDGTYWIDHTGGSTEPPIWCPGDEIPFRYYINRDHNGAFLWESQLSSPGQEIEGNFTRLTEDISVNNYVTSVKTHDGRDEKVQLANYNTGSDGLTKIPAGKCLTKGSDDYTWSKHRRHCMDDMFANSSFRIPNSMTPGQTVLRWRWYGKTNAHGKILNESHAEKSLFISCKDVVIGSKEQCKQRDHGFLL